MIVLFGISCCEPEFNAFHIQVFHVLYSILANNLSSHLPVDFQDLLRKSSIEEEKMAEEREKEKKCEDK